MNARSVDNVVDMMLDVEIGRAGMAGLRSELESIVGPSRELFRPLSAHEELSVVLGTVGEKILGALTFDMAALLGRSVLLPDFEQFYEAMERYIPSNWSAAHADPEIVVGAMRTTGIPLAQVPRPRILREVLKAKTRDEAMEVLLMHEGEVLDDCRAVIDGLPHEFGVADLSLAREAISACKMGVPSAGMALGVNVIETALTGITWTTLAPTHNGVRNAFQRYFSEDVLSHVKPWASFQPVQILYREWHRGDAQLIGPSRQQAAHLAIESVYGRLNALLTMMCLTAVLHGLVHYPGVLEKVWSDHEANERVLIEARRAEKERAARASAQEKRLKHLQLRQKSRPGE